MANSQSPTVQHGAELHDAHCKERASVILSRIRARCCEDAECWIWTGSVQGRTMPMINVGGNPMNARRAAWIATHGHVRKGFEVVQRCGSVLCCNPEHLKEVGKSQRRRIVGAARNGIASARMIAANRERQGKLTLEIAREIRASELPSKVLAAEHNVSVTLINYVRANKAWAEPSPFAGLFQQAGART